MKKSEQVAINEQVVSLVNCFNNSNNYALNWRKLRSCSAEVAPIIDCETGELLYYALRYRAVVYKRVDKVKLPNGMTPDDYTDAMLRRQIADNPKEEETEEDEG